MLALLSLAAFTACGDVLVVDQTLGPYPDIARAIGAASDGDTILVRPGTYTQPFTIDDLSVTIVADGGVVTVGGAVVIRNVGRGKSVVLSSLRVQPQAGPALTVDTCTGAIRIQNAQVRVYSQRGVVVNDSADVVLSDSSLRRESTANEALFAQSSNVFMSSCHVDGGRGTSLAPITVRSCRLAIAASTVVGGRGLDGWIITGLGSCDCIPPTYGGPALRATDSVIEDSDSSFTNGPPGTALSCGCWIPEPPFYPPVVQIGATTMHTVPGPALRLISTPWLARENASVPLTALGDASETLVLILGTDARRRTHPAYVGNLLVWGNPGLIERRVLGLASVATNLVLPDLTTVDAMDIHMQLLGLRPNLSRFGEAQVLTVVDNQF